MSAACLLFAAGFFYFYPDISALRRENPEKTAYMEHAEKEWRKKGKKLKITRIWVPLSRISDYLISAVLIAEDDKFWQHEGFDFEAMQKALEKNIRERKLKSGGSTVTQQLARNLYLSPSKTPLRKIREAVIAWRLERGLSKKRILELYLNVAQWGEGVYGAEAASRHYFGKPASALSPEEAARLASVLPNPKKYSPVGPSRYVEARSKAILNIMMRRGVVLEEATGVDAD